MSYSNSTGKFDADTSFVLGYGSWCRMRRRHGEDAGSIKGGHQSGWKNVPLLNALYQKQTSAVTHKLFHQPFGDDEDKSGVWKNHTIRTSSDTYQFGGNLSFELTDETMELLLSREFFLRTSKLDLKLCDGEGVLFVPGCVWSNFSLDASPGNLVAVALNFSSCNGYRSEIELYDPENRHDFGNDEYDLEYGELQPYWQFGNDGIQNFSLDISRDVQPVFLNEKQWAGPSYIRVGNLSASLNITCWERWFDHKTIFLGKERKLVFNDAYVQNSRGYSFAGIGGESMKSYSMTATAFVHQEDIFSIEQI